MLKQYHHMVGGAFRIFDAGIIAVAWILAFYLRFEALPLIAPNKGFPPIGSYLTLLPLIVILWGSVFSAMHVYKSRRILRRTDEIRLILKAHAVSVLLFISLTYLISEYKYSRGVVIYFALLAAVLLTVFRLSLRNSLRAIRRRGHNLRWVLGIGGGDALQKMQGRIVKFPELGLRMKSILTCDQVMTLEPGALSTLIRNEGIDQVLIALPRHQTALLDTLLAALKEETVDIQLLPDIYDFVTLGCEIETFDGIPIVHLNSSPLEGWGSAVKRATDVVLAAFGLLVISPLLVLIALLIRLTSKGPVFFRQERMGLDGQTFSMLKFRTMRTDAETQTGAVWAVANDTRKTKFGSFLRATSLDELPQLINVLRGDMSLVGPRPERPVFVSKFRHEIPHYMLRHKVKAGMTGWAQINGWRGNTSLDRRIECDLYYIRHWSYTLDIKILLLTIWKGFIHKNAY